MSKSYKMIDLIQGDIITYMDGYTGLHPKDIYNIQTSLCEIVSHRVHELMGEDTTYSEQMQDELEPLGD